MSKAIQINLIIFSFFYLLTAKSLTCSCTICPDDNDKCETKPGGYCYASVRGVYNSTIQDDDMEYDYGCMPPEQNGGLLQVSAS